MVYLLASYYDGDTLVGVRGIAVCNDIIGQSFDATLDDIMEYIDAGKIEFYKVKTREDMERWAKYTSMFDVKTGDLINEVKYVKLTDTAFADCLGKVYHARNLAELDNFVMNHVFTNLDNDEIDVVKVEKKAAEKEEEKATKSDSESETKAKKSTKKASKTEKSDDEKAYKEICGIGKYSDMRELTDKYLDEISFGPEITSQLLDKERVGRFNYDLADSKTGKVVPCVDKNTGLYGVCCHDMYYDNIWVLLEPVYKQIETVQSNASVYVAALTTNDKWVFIDLKKNTKSDEFIDWFSINNTPGKSGKLFMATTGDDRSGYQWHLMGKGLQVDRQIGCWMLLRDVLFAKGRGYAKLVNTIEFYDPRHGETVVVNMKDYTMDSMLNFRRAFQNAPEKQDNEDVVLFYNVICDATTGCLQFETDKGFIESSMYFMDVTPDFITSLTSFLGASPKDVSTNLKVKRHMEARHQYIYQKLHVDVVSKFKYLMSSFANYTSAKILGSYWLYKKIDDLDTALGDLDITKFKAVSKCNDGKDLYYKGSIICHMDKSVDLISFVRRDGRIIRVEYNTLLTENGEFTEESLSSTGMSEFVFKGKDEGIYDVNILNAEVVSHTNHVDSKPTYDIIQKYKNNKLSMKCTKYDNVVELKLNVSFDGLNSEDTYNLYVKLYDGLRFKTSEVQMKKLDTEGKRDIIDVREHAKAYTKLMNENQPVLSGFHQTAFKCEVI
jgi:hypothetical protein